MKSPALKIVVATLALAAGGALAQGYGYGPGMRGGWGPGAGANLSDEQRTKVAALQEQHREKNWKTMGELQKERFKLSELYGAARPDAQAIAEQEKKVDALREQMFKQRNDMRREMQALVSR